MTGALLALGSGGLIGAVLGLIGGGGSILAVPLLVYAVGVPPHVAIGTAALAVAMNALASLGLHARRTPIRWPCALSFSLAGVGGALAGAALGKSVGGQQLLALFGGLMIVVGILMLRPRPAAAAPSDRLTRANARRLLPRLLLAGASVGLLSGFFGIGGGFLIVPGLMLAADMDLRDAASASLVGVAAFGTASASSYAWSGLIDWQVAGLLVAGGLLGALAGSRANAVLADRKEALGRLFAGVVIAAGLYVAGRGIATLVA
ncbi:sulfite exporter TauE/SafE family protein [Reyranella sp.]|uniref:sulfite exporter TauE/SafE family protein n=1 Tax=Reyranella sp. TaxID=1929291 RepID=UPI003BAAEA6A